MSFVHRSGWNWMRACLASACVVTALAACCVATAASTESQGVMLDVRDARLAEVVLLLTQQSGANIFINPEVANKKVTARAENMPLDKALELIVKATAGVDFWKDGDGNYVVGGQRPVENKQADIAAPPVFSTPAPEPEVKKAVLRTEIIKLHHSDPTDILIALDLMAPSRDFFGGRSVPVAAILDEDRLTLDPVGTSTNQLKPIRAKDKAVPALDPGVSALDVSAGRSATPDTGSAQYRPPSSGGSRSMPAPTQAPGTGTNSLLPEGIVSVMPFSIDNSLIVRGTEEGIAEFHEVVNMLDIEPMQVMVKAEFIEVSTDDVRRFGIDWSINRLNQSFATNFNPPGNVVYNLTTGNLTAALRTELTRGSGKTINAPIITMMNNEVGQIQIARSIPYWTSTVVNPNNGSATTAFAVHSLDVATGLSVLPRVNSDRSITLTMAPQVEDTGRIYTGPDGTEIPETSSQSIAIKRRVMSGETIVCGGFIRKNDSFSQSRIPILGDLPIIGSLFRSTQRSGQETELLIFVTPTIIGEKSAGSTIGVSP